MITMCLITQVTLPHYECQNNSFNFVAGVKVTEVQAMVENHLKDLILKTFDPKKADTIFTEEGEVRLN